MNRKPVILALIVIAVLLAFCARGVTNSTAFNSPPFNSPPAPNPPCWGCDVDVTPCSMGGPCATEYLETPEPTPEPVTFFCLGFKGGYLLCFNGW